MNIWTIIYDKINCLVCKFIRLTVHVFFIRTIIAVIFKILFTLLHSASVETLAGQHGRTGSTILGQSPCNKYQRRMC